MDTEQEQIFDEIDDINFNSALENLETLNKDVSQKDNYACSLMVEMFMEKSHARIKKLKEVNKKLVEQLEKNMEYHDVVIGTYNEAQIYSIIKEFKCLIENYDNNNLHYDICPREVDMLATSHELLEGIFEENKILKNKCKKYEQTISKQADKISVLHQSNEMYEKFINFNRQIKYAGFITAFIAFIFGVTAFLSVIK